MTEEKWHQKTPVQAAIVSGVFALVIAIVGVVLKDRTPSEASSSTTLNAATKPVAAPTDIPRYDRYFSAESAAARKQLRGTLRSISAAESGLKINLIPPGSFGFSHASLFRYADFAVDRIPIGNLSFEIHKLTSNEVLAVAFVNADTQRQIQLNGKVESPATLYSDTWSDAPYAVRVNIASCRGANRNVPLDNGSYVIAVDCAPVRVK